MITYLHNHWSGRHSLKRTLWINCLTPFIAVLLIQQQLLEPLLLTKESLRLPILYSLTVAYGLILFVSIVAVNRKITVQSQQSYGAENRLLLGNIVVFLCGCVALVNLIDVRTHGIETRTHIKQAFAPITLQLNKNDHTQLSFSGEITPSSPRQLNDYLLTASQINTLVLDSTGGDIYAARAIAITVKQLALNTHVDNQCFSACNIVYSSGTRRTASAGAIFGFHRYQYQMGNPELYGSVQEQQAKDAAFFQQQGIKQDFIDRMFSASAQELWTPPLPRLLAAQLVHAVTR